MKINLLALSALLLSVSVFAGTSVDIKNVDGTITPIAGAEGQVTNTLTSCEDEPNSACRVEMQNSYSASKVADYQVKPTPGFLHTINCSGDGSAAAGGSITLYDSTSETGAVIWQYDLAITADIRPFTVVLNNIATIGLYLGYNGPTDIRCSVSFR